MTTTEILDRLQAVRRNGSGWMAKCAGHEDDHASLSVKEGDSGRTLFRCFAGCATEAIVAAMGLSMADLFPESEPAKTIVSTYDYRDADRQLLYQVVRYSNKTFLQRRPDGAGDWIWNRNGTTPVLYRLPELRQAPDRLVFITEGEKDADRLAVLGLIATTNVTGAGKWHDEYNAEFAGRKVVILPDNDEPGRAHAAQVAAALLPVAAEVRIVALPGLPPKGDVSD